MPLLLLPIALFALLVGVFARTAYFGTRAALRITPLSKEHRRSANRTLYTTAALVVSLELMLLFGVLPRRWDELFLAHFVVAVAYVGLIVTMRFILTGTYSRGVHIVLGIVCTADFVAMVATGSVLLVRALLA